MSRTVPSLSRWERDKIRASCKICCFTSLSKSKLKLFSKTRRKIIIVTGKKPFEKL